MTSEGQSHAARPLDLVALVTFDEEVRENQAVTLDGLADPEQQKTRPLNAALAQWLHLGRRMWINVVGREVRGIATARDLNAKSAWVIDTLIDAAGDETGHEVVTDLLGQASAAAAKASVTHLLFRTLTTAPAREPATKAGFRPALIERLWSGVPSSTPSAGEVTVRPLVAADDNDIFRLYGRATPAEARAQLGMTREEWLALRDRRWLRGGEELVSECDGSVTGLVGFRVQNHRVQLEMLVAPDDGPSASALLAAVLEGNASRELFALVPRAALAVEQALSDAGLTPSTEYVQLSHRLARPVLAEARQRTVLPIATGGGV